MIGLQMCMGDHKVSWLLVAIYFSEIVYKVSTKFMEL